MLAGAARLDKSEAEFHPQPVGQGAAASKETRRRRYALQATAAKMIPGEGVAKCGRFVAGARGPDVEGHAQIMIGARGAHLSRVLRCNSVWHCPCCAASIAAGRRDEVRALTDAHQAAGHDVFMLTLTIGHHLFDRCETTRQGVALAWRHVQAGKGWKTLKAAFGIVGNVRALEVTHGGAGWHPHLHILIFTEGGRNQEHLGPMLIARWAAAVERCGWGRISPAAQNFVKCETPKDAGDYITKFSPEWELTHAHLKKAQGGGRSPWQILGDVMAKKSPRDLELWKEYALAFKGARQLTYTKGLRERYGLREETDADLAAKEPPARCVIEINQDVLQALVKRKMVATALEIVETKGVAALARFLENFNMGGVRVVDWSNAPPDTPARAPVPMTAAMIANLLRVPVESVQRV